MNHLPRNYEGGTATKLGAALLVAGLAISSCSSLITGLSGKERLELDYTGMGVLDESRQDDTLNGQDCLKNSIYDPNSNAASFREVGDVLFVDPYGNGETLIVSGLYSDIADNLQPVDETSDYILKNAGCNVNFVKN